MKKFLMIVLVFGISMCSTAFAAPWAVIINRQGTLITMDMDTGEYYTLQIASEPYQYYYDLAITPDGRYAMVGDFLNSTVYRINIQDPTIPTIDGNINIGFYVSDIEITPDGKFAMVTGGYDNHEFSSIKISDLTVSLQTLPFDIEAVAIAPDNRTLVLASSLSNLILYGEFNPETGLLLPDPDHGFLSLPTNATPINIAISPDGRTVLVTCVSSAITVFEITNPGVLETREFVDDEFVPSNRGSLSFTPDGTQAYVLCSPNGTTDSLWLLNIINPWNITSVGIVVEDLSPVDGKDVYFGVDLLSISPDGEFALVGNPSGSLMPGIMKVELSSPYNEVEYVTNFTDHIPVGIAFIPTISAIGDLDLDLDIDGRDLHAFMIAFSNNTLPDGDINGDGIINSDDVDTFAQAFGGISQ